MRQRAYNEGQYLQCIENSERVTWKISEVLPDDYVFNFDRPFAPSLLTGEGELHFLNDRDRLIFSQIWGPTYLNLFAFVEEYITLFALNLATESTFKEALKFRAYVRFSEEEIKHQALFRKYVKMFNESFIGPCCFIENSQEVASLILSNSKLCVLLLTYHLEIVTQDHYKTCIDPVENVDEKFKEILKKHWLEEVQHAKIDLMKLEDEFFESGEEEFLNSIDEYFNILELFVSVISEQVKLSYQSLLDHTTNPEYYGTQNFKDQYFQKQVQAYFDCFIVKGLENQIFLGSIESFSKNGIEKIKEKTKVLKLKIMGK